MAPLEDARPELLRKWMRTRDPRRPSEFDLAELELTPEDRAAVGYRGSERPEHLSPAAWDRWRCLDALSVFWRAGDGFAARGRCLDAWVRSDLPLARLAPEDQARFLGWVVRGLVDYRGEVEEIRVVDQLAGWLVRCGVEDARRLRTRALADAGPPPEVSAARWRELLGELDRAIADHAGAPSRAGRG
jgi:hypothetical protein